MPCPAVDEEFDHSMPQPIADVVAAHNKISAACIAAVHDDMDARLINVVVNECGIAERRCNVVFHASHQIAGEPLKIEVAATLRRRDEAELVPARQATFGEGIDVAPIEFSRRTEEVSTSALSISLIARAIGKMFANGFRWRLASQGHNACLHDAVLSLSADSAVTFAPRVSRALCRNGSATSRCRTNCTPDGPFRAARKLASRDSRRAVRARASPAIEHK